MYARVLALLGTALLLCTTSCIELLGQRITVHYDSSADTLSLLLHYDGVHNNKEADQKPAEEKLRAFVAGGDVMLFDWFFHIQRHKLHEEAQQTDLPRLRELEGWFADRMKVETLGHYRDPMGQIGAAQLVVFEHAHRFLAVANAAIDEAILDESSVPPEAPATWRRWRQAAAHGHEWLRIEGHSLSFSCPVVTTELAALKMKWLRDLCVSWNRDTGPEPSAQPLHAMLATSVLSVDQRVDRITIRLGDPDVPTTVRCRFPRTYRDNMAGTLLKVVPQERDQPLLQAMLHGAPPGSALARTLAWTPAEEKVRAALAAARKDDADAARWLDVFAMAWNADGQRPPAPVAGNDPASEWVRWEQWYRARVEPPRIDSDTATNDRK